MRTVGCGDPPTVLLHDALANCQAQSGGVAISAEAGLKDAVNLIWTNAATAVGELGDEMAGMPPR